VVLHGAAFENPPANVVCITVNAVTVKLDDETYLGVAIVAAERPSAKEPGYFKHLLTNEWAIPAAAPVADQTRSFLADLDRVLESKSLPERPD
jgi:hypothetical protein